MAVIAIHKLSLKSLFIKKFLFIILAMLFSSFGMSNLSAQNNLTETMYDIGTATEDVYKTSKQIVSLTVQLDGRKKLLKKIGYAKKIKKPILKPLQKFFTAVDQSPIGKKVNVIEKGFTISRASVEFAEWATGKDVSPLAFTDSIAELSSLDPTGISDIAKTQVYDRLKKINEKMDEIRASEESTDNAYISIATKLVDEKIFNSIIANFDTSAIQNYQDAEKIYQMANNRYTKSINNSLTLIEQHIKSINNSINTKFTCLALCQAQNEEKKARVRLLSLWRERLNAHKSKNKKELIWTAITEKLVYDTYLLANDWKNSVQFVADQKIKNNETLKLLEFEPSTLPKVHHGKIDNSRIYLSHKENKNLSHELKNHIIENEIQKSDAAKKRYDNHEAVEKWEGFRTAALIQNDNNLLVSWSQRYLNFELKDDKIQSIQTPVTIDGISTPSVQNIDQNIENLKTNGPGTLQYETEGHFDVTAWGKWSTHDLQGIYGTDVQFKESKWVGGKKVNPSDMPKSGSAIYEGIALGHHYQNHTYMGKLHGTFSLKANFASNSIGGKLDLYKEGGDVFANTIVHDGKIVGSDFIANLTGFTPDASTSNSPPNLDHTHHTENVLKGSFNDKTPGGKPDEIGGTFNVNKDGGEVGVGIFAGEKK